MDGVFTNTVSVPSHHNRTEYRRLSLPRQSPISKFQRWSNNNNIFTGGVSDVGRALFANPRHPHCIMNVSVRRDWITFLNDLISTNGSVYGYDEFMSTWA